MRQQAGSNLLLKQMTEQQQMMDEQKQQPSLALSNNMNKHQLEYKPSTGLFSLENYHLRCLSCFSIFIDFFLLQLLRQRFMGFIITWILH